MQLEAKVSSLNNELMRERERVNDMWKRNCAQVAAFDETLSAKDDEIERLVARVRELEARSGRPLEVDPVTTTPSPLASAPVSRGLAVRLTVPMGTGAAPAPARRGKAPPVPVFSGENL